MNTAVVNYLCRAAFALAYPMICKLERSFGLRSNVAIVAIWHDDRLLLVRHSYRPGETLPGGTLKRGEAPHEGAAREVGEEVGISVDPDELKLLRAWTQQEGRRWLFEFRPAFLPRIMPDQREVVAARLLPRSEIPAPISMMLEPVT